MNLKFNRDIEVVEVNVHAKFQAKCSGYHGHREKTTKTMLSIANTDSNDVN